MNLYLKNDDIQLISKEGEEGVAELLAILEEEKTVFEVGDTLQVKGRLSFYRDEWKIFANTICTYKQFTSCRRSNFFHLFRSS